MCRYDDSGNPFFYTPGKKASEVPRSISKPTRDLDVNEPLRCNAGRRSQYTYKYNDIYLCDWDKWVLSTSCGNGTCNLDSRLNPFCKVERKSRSKRVLAQDLDARDEPINAMAPCGSINRGEYICLQDYIFVCDGSRFVLSASCHPGTCEFDANKNSFCKVSKSTRSFESSEMPVKCNASGHGKKTCREDDIYVCDEHDELVFSSTCKPSGTYKYNEHNQPMCDVRVQESTIQQNDTIYASQTRRVPSPRQDLQGSRHLRLR